MKRFRFTMWLLTGLVLALVACQPVQRQAVPPILSEHPIPTHGAHAGGITVGADGALWFVETGANAIGRITTDGVVTEYPVPTADAIDPTQGFVGLGPDGAIWFNEDLVNKLGRITPDGTITEFDLPAGTGGVRQLVAGPDGNLWVTASFVNKILKLNTAGEVLAEYTMPTAESRPVGMVVGPDGAFWFVLNGANAIGRMTLDGKITEYAIPTADSFPIRLTVGPDDALWFNMYRANKIGRISLTGEISEFDVGKMGPVGITAGADGALWFTGYQSTEIGRLTTDGVLTKIAVPTYASVPYHIVAGPDGNLWFTEQEGNQVGQIKLPSPTAAEQKSPVVQTPFTSKVFALPMSVSFGTEWSVSEEYPDLITLVGPAELGFILVNEATKVADAQPPFSTVPFPDDFVSWIEAHGLFQSVNTQPVVIGGFSGFQIDATSTTACADTKRTNGRRNWIFLSSGWNCRPNEHWRFIYLGDVNGERLLILNSGGPAATTEFNLGLAAAQKVLDTVVFSKP